MFFLQNIFHICADLKMTKKKQVILNDTLRRKMARKRCILRMQKILQRILAHKLRAGGHPAEPGNAG